MEIIIKEGSISSVQADTLIVNLFEGENQLCRTTKFLDQALSGAISELITNGDISGKIGEIGVIYPRGVIPARRIVIVGMGKAEKLDLETIRRSSATAIKKARDLKSRDIAVHLLSEGAENLDVKESAQAMIEGMSLGLYQFKSFKLKVEEKTSVESITLVEGNSQRSIAIEEGVRIAEAVADGVILARNLVNLPPNMATPSKLASTAEEIATEFKLKLTIGDREWAAERNMGGFLSVAKGAGEEPKFIVLEYKSERNDLDTVVIVGKGITFDTGGISLKPAEKMEAMKSDMSGAAAVLGTMKTVALLDIPLHVIGIAPCTENMPDAHAYHPADVITASNGKTIEIISTDAEGRMILSDALVYAARYDPKAVIDLATLTGACVIALGEAIAAGLFCTDDWLEEKLLKSGQKAHERVWTMPLWDDYRKVIKSEVADMKNSGGRTGGVGSSAIFLKEFVDYPWAHIDIAGMALVDKKHETPYIQIGGTGFGVRLLVELLRNW